MTRQWRRPKVEPDLGSTRSVWFFCLVGVLLAASSSQADDRVDFRTEIVPVLTKLGCNAGACHGSAAGRGGFKLSLYGSQPADDYIAIVQDRKGRRINRKIASRSLLLRKPGGDMEHGGEQLFWMDSKTGQLLANWIQQGAKLGDPISLRQFDVGPSPIEFQQTNAKHTFKFSATFSDGSKRDVTRWTLLTSNDQSSVTIDDNSNQIKVLRPGRHIVLARFLNQVKPIEILVPYYSDAQAFPVDQATNLVDQFIYQKLERLRIPANRSVDDSTFFRRICLDLTGRLPTTDQIENFLSDASPDKRSRWIKKFLDGDDFVDYWTYQIATQLRIRSQPSDNRGAMVYHDWLKNQIESRESWREIARQLLLAEGDSHAIGPANFYRTTGDARNQSEFVTESLMGAKLGCANCHDHPLDRWTQDDYHGLAAIFARVRQEKVVRLNPGGQNIHVRTGKPATPRIPGQRFVNANEPDPRAAFADWLTSDSNPYFARAMVNRIWKSLMGRGLVEPVDDLRSTNPATHETLLMELAKDFSANDCDIRQTIELICNSDAYQRESGTSKEPNFHRLFYGAATVRNLRPEVLADAIDDVTGVPSSYGDLGATRRAVQLHDPRIPSTSLDILGRCSRESSCESELTASDGLSSRLHLLNGDLLNKKISHPKSSLQIMIDAKQPTDEIVNSFYLRAFSRQPTPTERVFWKEQINGKGKSVTEESRKDRLEDFLWSLLSSKEFTTNH